MSPLRDCHRTSDSIYRYLRKIVVPFSMEGIAFNVECGDLFIGDLEAGRVDLSTHLETGLRTGGSDEVNDHGD